VEMGQWYLQLITWILVRGSFSTIPWCPHIEATNI
jgi:hypothetical protein